MGPYPNVVLGRNELKLQIFKSNYGANFLARLEKVIQ